MLDMVAPANSSNSFLIQLKVDLKGGQSTGHVSNLAKAKLELKPPLRGYLTAPPGWYYLLEEK